jgi:hypothetical protein
MRVQVAGSAFELARQKRRVAPRGLAFAGGGTGAFEHYFTEIDGLSSPD